MNREKLRDGLVALAHSFNQTLGQMIFTAAGIVMLFASIAQLALLYIVVLVTASSLAWTFRRDLGS
jgi:hypothetical protein